ncbi:alpha-ketoglutarate-dependent dioxygenase AlkB family protein [Tropicimonas marinistellae]|uniref:alpha-ketoglutarate-dependent dioxygenase AlkB family protein n=1 Tax=Tropicimonas marinistellae TaxID=1739787 RepID=UPI00083480C1|nr:alpha-ketoglutarate-dependent dioxygenase AlkB [Tropicimonas marinistellae]
MKKVPVSSQSTPTLTIRGVALYQRLLDRSAQTAMVEDLRRVVADAPLFRPETPRGQAMSVRMTSTGSVGWVSDRRGYRYQETHPKGMAWPPIPESVLAIWDAVAGTERQADTCLINYYDGTARMGMHQDRDEADFDQPVVSISLGDDALFRIGNLTRGGKTESVWLSSGDVLVMGGEARLVYHGIDRIRAGSSDLLASGGRINLTLRVARA